MTKANTTVMRISGYQADPMAATMQTRSIGLAKLNVSKNQKNHDRDLFSQSLKVKGNRLHDSGLKIDMVQKDDVS